MLIPGGSTAANLLRPLQCGESKVCRGLQAELAKKAEAGLGANHASQQSDNQTDKLK